MVPYGRLNGRETFLKVPYAQQGRGLDKFLSFRHNGSVRQRSLGARQEEMLLRGGTSKPRVRHGHTGRDGRTPTYKSWQKMIARCGYPASDGYKHYGAKGVRVCKRWRVFRSFLSDMGVRPEGTTLGRVLDRGDYKPGNCFWMTKPEQGLHQRNNNSLRRWEESR